MPPLKRLVSKQIGEILKEGGLITEGQLKDALEVQSQKGGLIGEILITLGYATEEAIAQALTIQYGFPYLPLDSYEIDKEIIKLIPVEIAKRCSVIPIDKIGATLTLAMVNPLDAVALEEIEKLTKCIVQPFVTTATSLQNALKKYYRQDAKS
jgi:type IV pilus assembly protein PilB